MNANKIAALNAAGEVLKGLNLGRVSLTYHPPCPLLPNESFTVSIGAYAGLTVGEGKTIPEALEHVLQMLPSQQAKAA